MNKTYTIYEFAIQDKNHYPSGCNVCVAYEKDEKADIDFGIENNKHIDERYFKLIKKIPFLPNTLLVFPRTNNTYHGVQKINIEGVERNLIQLNYYFKNII